MAKIWPVSFITADVFDSSEGALWSFSRWDAGYFLFFSFRLRTERFRQWLKLCPNVRRIQSKSLFWISLLPACAHTLTLSEDKVEMIQSHIWSFCKIPLHLFLSWHVANTKGCRKTGQFQCRSAERGQCRFQEWKVLHLWGVKKQQPIHWCGANFKDKWTQTLSIVQGSY